MGGTSNFNSVEQHPAAKRKPTSPGKGKYGWRATELKEAKHSEPVKQENGTYRNNHAEHRIHAELKDV